MARFSATLVGGRFWAALLAAGAFAAAAAFAEEGAKPSKREAAAAAATFTPEQAAFFEKEVEPILKARCYECHGGPKIRGGLQLSSREGVLRGGDEGAVFDVVKAERSRLLAAVKYDGELRMPPTGKLPAAEVETLAKWIDAGLPWGSKSVPLIPREEEAASDSPREAAAEHWAYQPLKTPAVPSPVDKEWVRTPIDAFVRVELEKAGLAPAPPAEPAVLLRRLFYDLTGLPPSPEEVDAFVADPSPAAYERIVEDLLASPRYGEKWGRHWLDLVRYAETNGYERDGPKPNVWRYRDYVVQAFNDDKPFDRFVREQLAGDELPGRPAEGVVAAGYYRLGLWDDEPADRLLARYDELDDVAATTAQVFLATTINCARCHDHKLDPIPQTDYYKFLAFFADVSRFSDTRNVRSKFNQVDVSPPERRAKYETAVRAREEAFETLRAQLLPLEEEGLRKMPAADQRAAEGPERKKVLREKLKDFLSGERFAEYEVLRKKERELERAPEPERDLALSIAFCEVRPAPMKVLLRGNPHAPGKTVEPGFPEVVSTRAPTIPEPKPDALSSGRRSVLADWIASPQNPLTPRVWANRVWQYHFGKGLVATPNDFGVSVAPPTHPELLDWLASDLVAGGWKLKRLHRLIATSNVYRMGSRSSEEAMRRDPADDKLWRFPPRRLTAEELRDSMLAASGELNLEVGGPSVYPPLPEEVLAGQSRPGEGWETSPPRDAARRSIYVHVKRSLRAPILVNFDQADTDFSCPVRYTTTVSTQALHLLNGAFAREQAEALAARLARERPGSVEEQIRRGIRLTTGRTPDADEVRRDAAFLQELQTKFGLSPQVALARYALVLLNANEFVHLD